MTAPTPRLRGTRRAARALPSALAALAAVTAVIVLALAAGCGGDKHVAPVVKGPTLPPGTPGNTAPDSTVIRWLAAYAAKVEGEADTLLADDFCYHFSSQTDPMLVNNYGNGWRKLDEVLSLAHLVHGFTNGNGLVVPGATTIQAQVINPVVLDDIDHPDSTGWYKRVMVTAINLVVDVPGADGTVTYNISSAFDLRLVRGDAAVLNAGQSHAATRWYVRQCYDLAAAIGGTRQASSAMDAPTPAATMSWGKLRAFYR